MRYRNSEGYADPTAGAAIAHIAYEERQQKRLEQQKKLGTAKRKKAMTKREKGSITTSPCSPDRQKGHQRRANQFAVCKTEIVSTFLARETLRVRRVRGCGLRGHSSA